MTFPRQPRKHSADTGINSLHTDSAPGYGEFMTEVEPMVRQRIRQHGPMSFDEFMQTALYHPGCGYYVTSDQDPVGKSGDFITSVSVGRTLGRMLALNILSAIGQLSADESLTLLEAGAHDGSLASDILTALIELNASHRISQYIIVEPSPRRRVAQQEKLSPHTEKVRWIESPDNLDSTSPAIFLSNELFDALPVRRLWWNSESNSWGEWLVDLDPDSDKLTWVKADFNTDALPLILKSRLNIDAALYDVIPHEFSIEISPAVIEFHEKICQTIGRGRIISLDYGSCAPSDQWLEPSKPDGTLRGFYRHTRIDDVLTHPGKVDITADVFFGDLVQSGEANGWHTDFLNTQQRFLTGLLADNVQMLEAQPSFWTAGDRKRFLTLISSQFFGERFKVLVQSRGTGFH